jgi:serine O-acetyltransferase
MIKTAKELKEYIKCDLSSLGYGRKVFPLILSEQNGIKLFIVLLRICEYLKNSRIYVLYFPIRLIQRRVALTLGFSIPLNICGPGLALPHLGPVIINGNAKIGKNARIHSGVVIGAGHFGSPKIGDNVYIGPGAKVYGNIKIGDNVVIGANSIVSVNIPRNAFVANTPAKIVSRKDEPKE